MNTGLDTRTQRSCTEKDVRDGVKIDSPSVVFMDRVAHDDETIGLAARRAVSRLRALRAPGTGYGCQQIVAGLFRFRGRLIALDLDDTSDVVARKIETTLTR